jgi:hypothetical protein
MQTDKCTWDSEQRVPWPTKSQVDINIGHYTIVLMFAIQHGRNGNEAL